MGEVIVMKAHVQFLFDGHDVSSDIECETFCDEIFVWSEDGTLIIALCEDSRIGSWFVSVAAYGVSDFSDLSNREGAVGFARGVAKGASRDEYDQ